jgi:hypothetical protein
MPVSATSSASRPANGTHRPGRTQLDLLEEVLVDPLQHKSFVILCTDVVLNEKACQHEAIDQDHAGVDLVRVAERIWTEATRRDEDPSVRLGTMQGADESLDVWAPYSALGGIPLRLNVDPVEPELVLLDDAVEPFVARAAKVLGRPAAPA